MFEGIRRLKLKIKFSIYLLILIILALLSFGIYVKVRQVQSVNYIQHQSASTSEMSGLLYQVSESLSAIEGELKGLRKETCLERMGTTADTHPNCDN